MYYYFFITSDRLGQRWKVGGEGKYHHVKDTNRITKYHFNPKYLKDTDMTPVNDSLFQSDWILDFSPIKYFFNENGAN